MIYIYYNPVKHGYAKKPLDWRYSSFAHREQISYPNVNEVPECVDALARKMPVE
uniref:Transposase n=1 Tax=Candidatus Kentrum sp. LPFa TaxID=2126335 RepID=A0A450XNW9_9GAMM|nr:MAG: hypothetical protein BECKLPF1236A_GA0070988_101228 [Candidatus Kentron sp. LPFa]VFK31025.1 MAG: hypothetical protein BECKLPF1236C_GA0070990_101262 [Candidatus Kentron sp. LPFa]